MAIQINAKILWGTSFANTLTFDYPTLLDDVKTWRQPSPGASTVRNDAGVTDAWVPAYDYFLSARARWFSPARWTKVDGTGFQQFIIWAQAGNMFKFYPNADDSATHADDCQLDEPGFEYQPDIEEADGSYAVTLTIRSAGSDFGLLMQA